VDVHEHEVGVEDVEVAQRVLGRRGLAHDLEPFEQAEHRRGRDAERELVVDDQHAHAHGLASDRYSSTALTRRWASCSSARASLVNTPLMCFSTARSLRPSDSAMALLLFPWAISASVSRSRGVSVARADGGAMRACTSASTTRGSITEPPRATSRIAPTSCR